MAEKPDLPVTSRFDQTLTLTTPSGGELVIHMPSVFRDTQIYYKQATRLFVINGRASRTKYHGFRTPDGREYWLRVRHRLFDALPEISMNGRLIAVPPPLPRRAYVFAISGGFPLWGSLFTILITPLTMISFLLSAILLPVALGVCRRYDDPRRGVLLPLIMIGVSWGVWFAILIATRVGYLPILPDP